MKNTHLHGKKVFKSYYFVVVSQPQDTLHEHRSSVRSSRMRSFSAPHSIRVFAPTSCLKLLISSFLNVIQGGCDMSFLNF